VYDERIQCRQWVKIGGENKEGSYRAIQIKTKTAKNYYRQGLLRMKTMELNEHLALVETEQHWSVQKFEIKSNKFDQIPDLTRTRSYKQFSYLN
jgi:hypothetical protein